MTTSVIGNSIISAAAFSIGGWLMSKIDKPNYLAETRRHNEAIEELTKARERFLEQETAQRIIWPSSKGNWRKRTKMKLPQIGH